MRAQSEILGVAVIVIILVIGGTFMLANSMRKKESPLETFTDPKIAESYLNAMLKAKTDKGIDLATMIKDFCYSGRKDLCGANSDCCEYAEKFMINALQASLGKMGKSYKLEVKRGSEAKRIRDIPINSECNDFKESVEWTYPIPPSPVIEVKLRVCK